VSPHPRSLLVHDAAPVTTLPCREPRSPAALERATRYGHAFAKARFAGRPEVTRQRADERDRPHTYERTARLG